MNIEDPTLTVIDKLNISKSSNPTSNLAIRLHFDNLPQIFSIGTFDHLSYERGMNFIDKNYFVKNPANFMSCFNLTVKSCLKDRK